MEIGQRKEAYGHLIKWFIKLGDIVVVNTFFLVLYEYLKHNITDDFYISHVGEIFLLINLSYFITSSFISIRLESNIIFFDKIVQNAISFTSVFMIVLLAGLSLFNLMNLSWGYFLSIYVALTLVYTLWHMTFRFTLKSYRSRGGNYKSVIIIGGGRNGVSVYNELSAIEYGFKVLGFFDDDLKQKNAMPNYRGTLADVEEFCSRYKIDEMYCTLPNNKESKILNLINFAETRMIRFYLVPEFHKYMKRKLVLSVLQSTPIIAIRREPLQHQYNRLLKRAFDVFFSSIVLITIFPIIYIVFGSIIKLTSRGPVFFKQQRTGLQGKVFDCYKFRSMRPNNEAHTKATTKSDPRVTRIGAFMRKTSIDEIPQFINVFLGDMSVVGPRPHMIQQTQLYEKLIDKFMLRHLIKPGITGWAQVSGFRGETETIQQMESRFHADVWYIENWTFLLDIKIVAVTILNTFRGDDKAY
ncbi:undecaprenyl-phosphate glucose phosphotransferase [Dysgonomonas sp. 216]|uniref:undecaprenyl-phosphate glucose phosphotransferase n=1 Tax=Dysgonomonas sp. 216 TaxID=2302934 RepID=UPI0013D0EE22|nr:undecaprenyl-phosphate glucose phosphotransferase [Dysgonomonas sp. 216]NDW18496.1 undecaprenyl-phosphate glucose phosphotransferase [Dysgonomonas sp. 216]